MAGPFRLRNEAELEAHLGKLVEVEGIAESHKDAAEVATSFYSFQVNDILYWPTGVAGKRVLVTGRLVLNAGLSEEELETIERGVGSVQSRPPHPPLFALEGTDWRVVDPK